MNDLFTLRHPLPAKDKLVIEAVGAVLLLLVWWAVVQFGLVRSSVLPSPISVVASIPELHYQDALIRNVFYSLKLNLLGYAEAIGIALPLGFAIGLIPIFRGLTERYITAMRYLPLTAVIGLFILWFGIADAMKIQFLTLGILVYLLPVVVQRIDEVEQVYLDTIKTLGASPLQTIRRVYIPSVVSRISDDIRVLVAISWTYIIIAEVVNKQDGGIGALIFTVARQSRVDKVFALLVVIIVIGFVQDKIFQWLDRVVFPFKYAGDHHGE